MATGVGGEEGVGGTLGVLVGMGVSVAAGAGVKVGLGVLVGVGAGVGALAINEVSGQPRHPNALPKTNIPMRITNKDLFIRICTTFSSQAIWPARRTSELVFGALTLWPEIPILLILSLRSIGDFRPILYHTLQEIQRLGEALFSLLLAKDNTPPSLFLKIYLSQGLGLEF